MTKVSKSLIAVLALSTILLISISVFFIYKNTSTNKSPSKEEIIKLFMDNYNKFEKVSTSLEKVKGYFYADNINNGKEIRIDSNKNYDNYKLPLNNVELKDTILYIFNSCKLTGVYQDENSNAISFSILSKKDSRSIVYFIDGKLPEGYTNSYQYIKDKWYYFYGQHE